jgi:outer membrane protein
MRYSHFFNYVFAFCFMSVFCFSGAAAADSPSKIGIISIQKILESSVPGRNAQKKLEAKAAEFQIQFQNEQKAVEALKVEIDKNAYMWNDTTRQSKERAYQKKFKQLQEKSEDYRFELKKLEKEMMEPILKVLNESISQFGKKHGYAIIMENSNKGLTSRIGMLYADETLDISDLVRQEMDSRLTK